MPGRTPDDALSDSSGAGNVKCGRLFAVISGLLVGTALFWLVDLYRISSHSMAPTLLPGDMVVATRIPSAFRSLHGGGTHRRQDPKHDEVWVYAPPSSTGEALVKRVIGIPGDTIAMVHGRLYVNHHRMVGPRPDPNEGDNIGSSAVNAEESFAWQAEYLASGTEASKYRPTADDWGPLVVPRGSYFLLGDNRHRSIDSRHNGFVDIDRMIGRVRGIYFSVGAPESDEFPSAREFRWRRLGRVE